ncbi:synapsin-1 [Triticum aestivum]|uniref:synapsin-1 n=1 Tax=Triticum aestivum TaxID=4565 RepID=UPI001D0171F5|nr:synapsin-1-like [Triticum aestivum]
MPRARAPPCALVHKAQLPPPSQAPLSRILDARASQELEARSAAAGTPARKRPTTTMAPPHGAPIFSGTPPEASALAHQWRTPETLVNTELLSPANSATLSSSLLSRPTGSPEPAPSASGRRRQAELSSVRSGQLRPPPPQIGHISRPCKLPRRSSPPARAPVVRALRPASRRARDQKQ